MAPKTTFMIRLPGTVKDCFQVKKAPRTASVWAKARLLE
jgi:hypothetical protein